MNKESFDMIIRTVRSCITEDQYLTALEWIMNLRELYHFSPRQNNLLNDEYLTACELLTVRRLHE